MITPPKQNALAAEGAEIQPEAVLAARSAGDNPAHRLDFGCARHHLVRQKGRLAGHMRVVWVTVGGFSAALGALGVVLPLLPTTPFMLLAAYSFARSSPRLHVWLVTHPRFGPPIADWQRHGAISRNAKRLAMVAIAVTFAISLASGVPREVLLVQAAVLSLVTLFILTRPSGPRGSGR